LRGNILREMVVTSVNAPIDVPQFAVDAVYNARNAKRDIKYATVKFSDFKVAQPTEEQLMEYYAQNPKVVPESRSVSYVFVEADTNKPDVYDEGFKTAQQIEDLIISGETMQDSAAKHKAKFVSVKNVERGANLSDKVLSDDLIAKLFAMDSGVESELLELKNGFAILRVDEIHPAHNAEFNDIKKDLVDGWKKSEQRKNAYARANEILIDARAGKKLPNAKSASVTRTDGATLEILSAAFAGKEGDNVIVEDANAFYVMNIGETVMPVADAKKQDAVRQELKGVSGRYVVDDYSQFLKRHYPVRVNDKVFRRFIMK